MLTLIELALVLGAVSILTSLERKLSRLKWSGISPFVLLSVPYTVVLIIQVYSIFLYNLEPLSFEYVSYLLIHFFITWLVCILFEGQTQAKSSEVTTVTTKCYDDYLKFILIIGIFVSIIQLFHFYKSGKSVSMAGQLVQEDFQLEYSGGVYFYLRLVSMLCSAYLLAGVSKKRPLLIFAAVFCLLPVFLTFVKSVVILSLIAGVIGNIVVNDRKIRIKHVVNTVMLGFAVFFGVYLVEICIWDLSRLTDPDTYSYIFAKMNFYFISGPQSFNVVVGDEMGISNFQAQAKDNLVLAPLINFLHILGLTESIKTACPVWTFMGYIPGYGIASGNVYSIIGQYVLYCGVFGSILANAFFTSIVCYFYCRYHLTGNPFLLVLYGMFGAFFCMGWFDDYFCQTFWVYMIFLLGFIYLIGRFALNVKKNNFGCGQYVSVRG